MNANGNGWTVKVRGSEVLASGLDRAAAFKLATAAKRERVGNHGRDGWRWVVVVSPEGATAYATPRGWKVQDTEPAAWRYE